MPLCSRILVPRLRPASAVTAYSAEATSAAKAGKVFGGQVGRAGTSSTLRRELRAGEGALVRSNIYPQFLCYAVIVMLYT